jgi:hypothetical protein
MTTAVITTSPSTSVAAVAAVAALLSESFRRVERSVPNAGIPSGQREVGRRSAKQADECSNLAVRQRREQQAATRLAPMTCDPKILIFTCEGPRSVDDRDVIASDSADGSLYVNVGKWAIVADAPAELEHS